MQITRLERNGFVSSVGELIPCLTPVNSSTTFHRYQVSMYACVSVYLSVCLCLCVLFMSLRFHVLAENDIFFCKLLYFGMVYYLQLLSIQKSNPILFGWI